MVRFFWARRGGEAAWRRLVAPAAATVLLATMAWLCIDHFDVLLNVAPGSLPTKILSAPQAAGEQIGAVWIVRPHGEGSDMAETVLPKLGGVRDGPYGDGRDIRRGIRFDQYRWD